MPKILSKKETRQNLEMQKEILEQSLRENPEMEYTQQRQVEDNIAQINKLISNTKE